MAKIATIGSMSQGHGGWPPRSISIGSDNVFAEGAGVNRVRDTWDTHCNPLGDCHQGDTAKGSSTVYCNGRQVGRIGDPITCGDTIATGKDTVNVGG